LETYGSLTLEVQQFQLFFQDEPVYENRNRMESMAFKFYIDGLREIVFRNGLKYLLLLRKILPLKTLFPNHALHYL